MRFLAFLLGLVAVYACELKGEDDYYEILDVERDADEKAIKKSYKKLSLLCHPDRPGGDAEKFAMVGEAYGVLTDPEKRQNYDLYGKEGLEKAANQRGGGNDLFSRLFNQQQGGPRRGADIGIELSVSLKDLYTGRRMKVAVERQILCPKCRGTGAKSPKDMEKCHECGGKGVVIQKRQLGPGFVQQIQAQCSKCGGKGRIIKEHCPHCHGDKVARGQKLIDVMVEQGMANGQEITFDHMADESPEESAGAIVFKVIQDPHPTFRRNGMDLHYKATISLVQALTGFSFDITHLDDHKVTVSSDKITRPGEVKRVVGEGMPRHNFPSEKGDLLVEFTVQFPRTLSADQKAQIKELLKDA